MTGRLRGLIRRGATAAAPPRSADDPGAPERCDLCATPIPPEHQHLVELSAGLLRCACRPCAMVLDLSATHGGRYRLVPERLQALPELAHDDAVWETLRIPVALAFLVRHSESGPVAVFPGALGPTDATIDPPEWSALEAAHPVIRELQSDVEAVLVNRARGARDCWLVPIDVCYRLVALLRGEWKGLSGGDTVWEKLDLFFDDLRRRAAPASSEPGEVAR